MKRFVVLCIVIMSVVVLVSALGCQQQVEPPSVPSPTPTPAPAPIPTKPKLDLKGIPQQAIYQIGEEIEIDCVFTNVYSEPLVVTAFYEDYNIKGLEIFSRQKTYKLGQFEVTRRSIDSDMYEVKVKPGEATTYRITWDQKDDNGEQVPPGWYSVYVGFQTQKATIPKVSRGSGPISRILIAYPQGHMEKTIEVNQSVTVNGLPLEWQGQVISIDVTMTLEGIELTPETVKFFLLATSPHYILTYPKDPVLKLPSRPPWGNIIYGQYCVDSVTKNLGGAFQSFPREGVRFGWGVHNKIDPIPSDANTLILTISTWGDWEGPWEFHISLE